MAKGGKKAPASIAGMKPITSFFPRKLKTVLSTPPTSSSTTTLSTTPSQRPSSSSSHPPDETLTPTLRRSTRLSEEPRPAPSSSKKPTMRAHAPSLCTSVLSPSRAQAKRKAKFDSDSDGEHSSPPAVVYVKPSVRSQLTALPDVRESPLPESDNCVNTSESARKKPCLSSDTVLENPSITQVRSSQSPDELSPFAFAASHLATPTSDAPNYESTGSSPLEPALARSPSGFDAQQHEAITPATTDHSFSSVFDILTPPLTDAASDDMGYTAPPSPVALDAATKTAKLIADIRAQAFAKFSSSPEQAPLHLSDPDDDSSDDDLPSLFLHDINPTDEKGKAKVKEPSLAPASNMRYSLRNRIASSPVPNAGSSSARNSPEPSLRSASTSKPVKKVHGRKQTSFNPLDDLLKEKRLADKRGKGDDALLVAENAVLKLARGALLDEMDEEEDTFSSTGGLSAQPSLDASGFLDEVSLAEEDRKRLFGEEGGKDIMNILQSDKEKKAREKANQKAVGIPLWRIGDPSSANDMKVDFVPPVITCASAHPMLEALNSALRDRDHAIASLILESGTLSTIPVAGVSDVINCLFELAFSPEDNALGLLAFQALTHIWGQTYPSAGPSFSAVLRCLVRFAADKDILEAMGWKDEFVVPSESRTCEQREDILYRFVRCLSSSATHIKQDEIPDTISALLLIGMDSASSVELRQDIVVTVNSICASVSPEDEILTELESAVVNKALAISTKYEPVNMAYLVSFLVSGTGRTRRIGQWIAHCMITGQTEVPSNTYSELPSLQTLLEHLTDMSIQSVFALHENTDYVDLGFYIYILSAAMSNMKGYVEREKALKSQLSQPLASPTKSFERLEADLQLVREALENLHGRISDTRAAHLERSRTKAAVKALSMRIHYQREALLRSGHRGGGGKPRPSLHRYFIPKQVQSKQ